MDETMTVITIEEIEELEAKITPNIEDGAGVIY